MPNQAKKLSIRGSEKPLLALVGISQMLVTSLRQVKRTLSNVGGAPEISGEA